MLMIARGHIYIVMGAMFYGLITVAGQYFANAGFSLYEISLLVISVPVVLLPLVIVKPQYRISKTLLGFYLVFGLIGAVLQITQFAGIVLGVPVAVVALLLYSQPVWTTLLSKLILDEQITKRKLTASGLALAGIFFLVNPSGTEIAMNPIGLISAILAGIFLSLWVIWGRKSGLKKQHFIATTFGYALFSSLWLLLALPFLQMLWPETVHLRLDFLNYFHRWEAVIGFALFAGILPASLAFAGMLTVEASISGILMLFEPVSAAVLAYFLFDQSITASIWFGGGLILFANYVILHN